MEDINPSILLNADNPVQLHINQVLYELYPTVFEQIHQLILAYQADVEMRFDEVLQSYLLWLQNALDDVYRKEKVMLFPKIIQLTANNKADFVPNYDWIYALHKDILQHIQKTKLHILRYTIDGKNPCCVHPIYKLFQDVESSILQLTILVEHHIIASVDNKSIK